MSTAAEDGATKDGAAAVPEDAAAVPGEAGNAPGHARAGNIVAAVVLLCVCVLVIVQSGRIGEPGRASDPGAGGYPVILAVVLAGLAVMLAFRRGHGERLPTLTAGLKVLGVVVSVVAYAMLMRVTGYVLATAAFVVVTALLMGSRQPVRLGILAIALSVGLFLLFYTVFGVSLPRGNIERLIS